VKNFMALALLGLCLMGQSLAQTVKKGDQVIHNGSSIRVVAATDTKGRIILAEGSEYYRTLARTNEVSKVIPSGFGLSKGSLVLISKDVRKVEAVSESGIIVLREDANWYQSFLPIDQMDPIVGKFKDLKVNDEVILDDSIRSVEYLTKNGKVILREDRQYFRSIVSYEDVEKLELN
jgi:hypothetical protein